MTTEQLAQGSPLMPKELTMHQLAALAQPPLYTRDVDAIAFSDPVTNRGVFIWPPEFRHSQWRVSTYRERVNDFRPFATLPEALTYAAQFMA